MNLIDDSDIPRGERELVERWNKIIDADKRHAAKDFARMRESMNFCFGIQRAGQQTLLQDEYEANFIQRFINNRVAALYAKNPTAIASTRSRLYHQVWDGKPESLTQAMASLSSPDQQTALVAQAIVKDYVEGQNKKALLERVGQTQVHLFAWIMDDQKPSFKMQMKQLVRRVSTCGVGFVRSSFTRQNKGTMTEDDTESSIMSRMQKAQRLTERIQSGDLEAEGADAEQVRLLVKSVGASLQQGDQNDVDERITYEFPTADSIIVDRHCRALKGFIGARHLTQEYCLPRATAEALFEVTLDGTNSYEDQPSVNYESKEEERVYIREVYDLDTKMTFVICKGYHRWLSPPTPPYPAINEFWPFDAITFNDCEVQEGLIASIYPPSDVDLLRSMQKEWNRSREAKRIHRRANAPKWFTGEGWISDIDAQRIADAIPGTVTKLKDVNRGDDLNKLMAPLAPAPIDPALYDTSDLVQDMFFAMGTEQGPTPASSQITATGATINEQQRIQVSSSNADDLDDFLTSIANKTGQMTLRAFSEATVKRIVGEGAVWPDVDREEIVDCLMLKVAAASSGRPNKALEIQNFQQLAPILIQAGVPMTWIAQEAAKRLDERIDLSQIMPLLGLAVPPTTPLSRPQQPVPTRSGQSPSHTTEPANGTAIAQAPR